MIDYKQIWRRIIHEALREEFRDIALEQVVLEMPPRAELGDLAFPMFSYARLLKRSPNDIALAVLARVSQRNDLTGEIRTQGPYVNIFLRRHSFIEEVIAAVQTSGECYGKGEGLQGQKIIVEFSSPNTNKPLHLGHLRNDAIGMCVTRVLQACSASVRRVNLINDRGIHICKSMLAYQLFGEGTNPEKSGLKSDHLVGDFYVRYNEWAQDHPEAEKQARDLLKKWEQGDAETLTLWRQMNTWAIEGIEETYHRTGVAFDQVYFESATYQLGREEVLKGHEKQIFYKEKDGSIWVDLENINLDKKVLLRGDGTSLYLTQDIGTAVQRYADWPFDRLIFVVGSEQRYHFQVLFTVLALLGHSWAEHLHHLAYGMVNLPEGKMKSREGTVVDADDLLDTLTKLAAAEIEEKQREEEIQDLPRTTAAVALGALHYFLLQTSPYKDMVFNPQESIAFNGNTGPYLQYTGARICSMLRKYRSLERFGKGRLDPELLNLEVEWELAKQIAAYPETISQTAGELNPSILTTYLFELAKIYSRYYHDHQVLHNEDDNLVFSRIKLAEATLQVLRNGLALTGIPFLEKM